MNHAEHLISTIVSTLNSNKINKIHQVNINTNNIDALAKTTHATWGMKSSA